ncbi:MAG TPA: hypothetical protein VN748_17050 [Pseudonocardiaceae bacterium]|nr:hypothetical protein [Pseudonocardiaceae bacterium]
MIDLEPTTRHDHNRPSTTARTGIRFRNVVTFPLDPGTADPAEVVCELLGEYRATASRLDIPAAEAPYALVEAVIHGYDIAWPLKRTLNVPAPSLFVVAQTCRRTGLFQGSKQRSAGLELRACDLAWSAGSARKSPAH